MTTILEPSNLVKFIKWHDRIDVMLVLSYLRKEKAQKYLFF